MNLTFIFVIFTLLIMFFTVIVLRKLIPFLTSKHIGQKILDIGPRWHKNKEGTPTMGGVSFIFVGLVAFIIYIISYFKVMDSREILLLINIMVYSLLNGMIGIIDDVAKIRKKRNEGLTPIGKFALQSVFAILFLISLRISVGIETVLKIPFTNVEFEIGFLYYILAFFMLCGIVNSVNLTDGIDGLASTIVFTIGLLFTVINIAYFENYVLTFISAVLIGSAVGFLSYNFYPARIFMGDTGSLYLGGIIAASSFLLDNILLVLIYGFVFVIEALSDVLQVAYFKISKGKRLFKMAPLHHHFEKSGWSEIKIVTVFAFVNAICCIIAFLGFRV